MSTLRYLNPEWREILTSKIEIDADARFLLIGQFICLELYLIFCTWNSESIQSLYETKYYFLLNK